jgi:hypothetical protein
MRPLTFRRELTSVQMGQLADGDGLARDLCQLRDPSMLRKLDIISN